MSYKKLGSADPLATTETVVGTVPGGKEWVVSTIVICNREPTDTTVRFAHADGGGATTDADYLVFDASLPANDVIGMTLGVTAAAGDVFRCYANDAGVTFTMYGEEIT